MKNLNKILFAVSGVLLLGGGAVLAYMQERPQQEFSDLTLGNIEALVVEKEIPSVRVPCCPAYWFNYCLFEMVMGDGTVANGKMEGAINC